MDERLKNKQRQRGSMDIEQPITGKTNLIGLVKNLDDRIYHSVKALSASGIKEFMKAPAKFKAWQDSPDQPTPAMILGTAVHMACLEPKRFMTDVAVYSGVKRGASWDAFLGAGHPGRLILNPEDYGAVLEMKKSVMANEIAAQVISGAIADGTTEESFFWNDPTHGFRCKVRTDIRRPEIGMIADIKTCQDASPDGFQRSCATYHYDVQAAWYIAGVRAALPDVETLVDDFLFIAVEKEPPYLCMVHRPTDAFIDNGRAKIRKILGEYAECLSTCDWYGYDKNCEIADLDMPAWGMVI